MIIKFVCRVLLIVLLAGDSFAQTRVLSLYVWDEYVSPEVVAQFEREFAVDVKIYTFSSDDERDRNITEISSERFDLILVDDSAIGSYVHNKLVAPLSSELLPNLKYLVPGWNGERELAPQYVVPYTKGTFGLMYRESQLSDVQSWRTMFEPDPTLAGHIGVSGQPMELLPSVLLYLGENPTQPTVQGLHRTEQLLHRLWPSIKVRTSDITELREAFLSGALWLAQGYSVDAEVLKADIPDLKFVIPQEGGFFWFDSWAISSTSKESELAHQFLNFLYREDIARLTQAYTQGESFHRDVHQQNEAHEPVGQSSTLPPMYMFRDPGAAALRRIISIWYSLSPEEEVTR